MPQERELYLKSAVAFANGAGGGLIFGVKDQTWDATGSPDDEVFQKDDALAHSIYDATQVAGEEVSPGRMNALCERMYRHALDLCKSDDLRRSRKRRARVWQKNMNIYEHEQE